MNNNFRSLSKDKIEFVKRFTEDTELAKCLLSNDPAFKDYSLTEKDKENLLWNNIYPCQYTLDVNEEAKSCITMKFKYKKVSSSNIWKAGYITFFLFCHKTLLETKYGVLRYDYMLEKVNELILNTKNTSWIGKMEFDNMEEIVMDNKGNYIGVMVVYRNTELL